MWFKGMLTSCSSDVGSIKDYKKQSRITMSRLWTESVTVCKSTAKTAVHVVCSVKHTSLQVTTM